MYNLLRRVSEFLIYGELQYAFTLESYARSYTSYNYYCKLYIIITITIFRIVTTNANLLIISTYLILKSSACLI